jgi:hypothetical protein
VHSKDVAPKVGAEKCGLRTGALSQMAHRTRRVHTIGASQRFDPLRVRCIIGRPLTLERVCRNPNQSILLFGGAHGQDNFAQVQQR